MPSLRDVNRRVIVTKILTIFYHNWCNKMQQVAHIFSRIERSKIYQFGSFSLRSFCKSELNFASSFASKLRKFGRKKSELIATIFPSRVTQMQLKIAQGFARSCVKILYGYWFNTRTKSVWFLLQHHNDVAAKYVTTHVHTWTKIITLSVQNWCRLQASFWRF